MTTPDPFAEPVRAQQKLRLAITGPSKSGKTFSALMGADILADGGPVAVIDTEHGRATLYADWYRFRHVNLTAPYSPDRYIAYLHAAAEHGYAVVVIDSLSHGWYAEGGVLDIVDRAAEAARGNKFAGWQVGTPAQNALMEAILASPCHVIATMRSKMAYAQEEEEDRSGRKRTVIRKLGLQPIQRDNVEYEFDIVGEMTPENALLASGRCSDVQGRRYEAGRTAEFFTAVKKWLDAGEPVATAGQRASIDLLRAALTDDQRSEANAWIKQRRWRLADLTSTQADELVEFLSTLTSTSPDE